MKTYADLMDEVRLRTEFILGLIESQDDWRPQFLEEVCWLQIRMISEVIALACMLAHGDVIGKNQLDRQKPNDIFKVMADINPDFFPKPVSLTTDGNGFIAAKERAERAFLTPSGLVKLWSKAGDRLHRGKVRHVIEARGTGPIVDLDEITESLNETVDLLRTHVICAVGVTRMLLVNMCDPKTGRSACVPLKRGASK